jgi:hypothetical protein
MQTAEEIMQADIAEKPAVTAARAGPSRATISRRA